MKYTKAPYPLTCIILTFCVSAAQASTIIADFTDGVGTASADQYTGIAGSGWAGAWTPNGIVSGANVVSTNPLNGGGNHLIYGLNTANSTGTVSRQWNSSAISYTSAVTISFDLRLDSGNLNNTNDRISLFEGSSSTDSSFGIYAFGATNGSFPGLRWGFYNGTQNGAAFDSSRLVNTGMVFGTGTVWSFTLNLDPSTRTWTGSITDGTNTFNSGTLGFNTGDISLDGILNFGQRKSFSSDNQFVSLDNISIVPEPSPWSLLALGLGGFILLRRVQRKEIGTRQAGTSIT